jgi:hypothetical protein
MNRRKFTHSLAPVAHIVEKEFPSPRGREPTDIERRAVFGETCDQSVLSASRIPRCLRSRPGAARSCATSHMPRMADATSALRVRDQDQQRSRLAYRPRDRGKNPNCHSSCLNLCSEIKRIRSQLCQPSRRAQSWGFAMTGIPVHPKEARPSALPNSSYA